jgi:hypothetical protein
MFGSRMQTVAGIVRALAASPGAPPTRAVRAAARLPRAVGGYRSHVAALCEVAQMLTDRLGLPPSVRDLFVHLTERWDGKGGPATSRARRSRSVFASCTWHGTPRSSAYSAATSMPQR